MLMRFDPFREIDRLAEQAFDGPAKRATRMPMDAYRRGDELVVRFDLPGVDPASIDVTVDRNVLKVRAERTWERDEGDELLVSERGRGTFNRQLVLGEALDTDALAARYDSGVLTLTVPVAERSRSRRIEVAGGGSPAAVEPDSGAAPAVGEAEAA